MTKFNTKLVHGKSQNDNDTGAVNVPIYNSSTFVFPKVDAKLRWDYERSGNPTRDYLEDQLAELENGDRGFAFSSGLAAVHAVFALFKPGDHIIVGKAVYGGTFRLINQFFKRWQLSFTVVDTQDLDAVSAATKNNTKAIYFETFSNPLLEVTSVKAIAKLAKQHGLLTIVDNTFLTPYLQQPLDLGADIVIHSATKYLGGHSDVVAGAVVTKTPQLSDAVYFNQNGIGAVLSPESANLISRGIKTLAVRIDRHEANAAKIVDFLAQRDEVTRIHYPGIKGTKDYEIAKEETNGYGGVLSFELADSIDAAAFVEHLKLISLAVSLGSVESLIELPYKMTHAELSAAEQAKTGISPQLVRLSVGIEDVHDLIADLESALNATK